MINIIFKYDGFIINLVILSKLINYIGHLNQTMSCQQIKNSDIYYHVNYCAFSPSNETLFYPPKTVLLHILPLLKKNVDLITKLKIIKQTFVSLIYNIFNYSHLNLLNNIKYYINSLLSDQPDVPGT